MALAEVFQRPRRRPRAGRDRLRARRRRPRRSTRSRSSSARTASRSSSAPAASASSRASVAAAPAPQRVLQLRKEHYMATIHRDGDLDLLNGKVAVVGYGSQGHAHALNLHDSGVDVVVGLREGSGSRRRGRGGGARRSRPSPRRCGARRSSRSCSPTTCRRASTRPTSRRTSSRAPRVLFAHGFNVHFGRIAPPAGHDVIMVAPKAPGHIVRELFTEGVRHARRSSRSRRTRAATRSTLALAYGGGHRLRRAPACSRRRSPRRPRATSSASRPCSAAASPS